VHRDDVRDLDRWTRGRPTTAAGPGGAFLHPRAGRRDEDRETDAAAWDAQTFGKQEIVPAGEHAHRLRRYGTPAGGALDAVADIGRAVPRIHPGQSIGFGSVNSPSPDDATVTAALRADTPREYGSPTMERPTATDGSHPGGDGDQFRHAYSKDKAQLVRRLSRMEGQVRGIARMIEREEYCVDILQQTAALRAAVDALSVLVLEDHVQGCVRTAAERGEADRYVDEVIDVVRRTLGRPVRSTTRAG
jgi:CsoR family transcriptional regulator, copper-sensing transcriptional repressor